VFGVADFDGHGGSTMSGAIVLCFCLWMLLTSAFTLANAVLGLVAAICVCWLPKHRFSALQLMLLVGFAVIRLPQALGQACWIVLRPHEHERITSLELQQAQDPWRAFCQIFLITYTPKSLVVSDEEDGCVQVHSLERKDLP
jgi:multicomponent Na+:H+ antiporter subunit E